MKTRHEFQLEFEAELDRIEQEIDQMRRERRVEEQARAAIKNGNSLYRPHIIIADDET